MVRGASRWPPATPRAEPFFSPDDGSHRYLGFGGRVTWPRLLVRIAITLALLAAVDAAVALTLTPSATYQRDYRLPRTLPTSQLRAFAESIHGASLSRSGGPIVAFLGASPTWGHRIKSDANTFPAAFSASGRRAGWSNRTYNLASNGQFLGDEYFIAKGISPDADVVFVQLTYHTFNPKAREGKAVRYPEIPQLLRVDVSTSEAALLGVSPSANADARSRSRADELLSRHWLLWRERDTLDRRLFGGRPQDVLARRPAAASTLTSLPDDVDGEFVAFDQLEPQQQMAALIRYTDSSAFRIDANDTDVRFLGLLAEMLRARGKKAVFFMSPLNRSLVEEYELIDPDQYKANVEVLRWVVGGQGFPLIDYNTGDTRLPASAFADISHTTDEGGRTLGALLYRDTWRYLGTKRP